APEPPKPKPRARVGESGSCAWSPFRRSSKQERDSWAGTDSCGITWAEPPQAIPPEWIERYDPNDVRRKPLRGFRGLCQSGDGVLWGRNFPTPLTGIISRAWLP